MPKPAQFDAEYLRRLKAGDPETQGHFSTYFGTLLHLKLAKGVRSREMLLEVRQDTLVRVLEAVKADKIDEPASLGAFVCSTANYVLWEQRKADDRNRRDASLGAAEPADSRVAIERDLINDDRKQIVESVLAKLPKNDQEVLRLVLLDECDKEEACRRLGVTQDYLRVVLHRAKGRFRDKLRRKWPRLEDL